MQTIAMGESEDKNLTAKQKMNLPESCRKAEIEKQIHLEHHRRNSKLEPKTDNPESHMCALESQLDSTTHSLGESRVAHYCRTRMRR